MLRNALFFAVLSIFGSTAAFADCKATVFADDWVGDLRSVNDVNGWCGQRAKWYRVDTSKYQPSSYCFSHRESRYDSYGREYYVYPTLFWWKLKDFSRYYQDEVLNDISYYLRDFSYKGWPSSIKIKFEPNC